MDRKVSTLIQNLQDLKSYFNLIQRFDSTNCFSGLVENSLETRVAVTETKVKSLVDLS